MSKPWKRRDTRQRFEQYARHPGCAANVASAVLGVSMFEVAERERKGSATFGQSPFALAQGVTFERSLFANGARRLREELARTGVLASDAATFIDLRLRQNGGPCAKLDDAAARTRALLQAIATAEGRSTLPVVVAGAALELPGQPVLLPEAMLALDALVIRPGTEGPELVVGEVKTYADRAGFTDRGELATARAQAGAYFHGLQVALSDLGLERAVRIAPTGFLVLARPGSAFPVVRAGEELRFQAVRAEKGFAQLRAAAAGLSDLGAEPAEEEAVAAVVGACTDYRAACVGFCERAQRCHELAFRAGTPAVLGDETARFLGPVTLDRAAALLAGDRPKSVAEESFAERARSLGEVAP